jgi:hypothetical protein
MKKRFFKEEFVIFFLAIFCFITLPEIEGSGASGILPEDSPIRVSNLLKQNIKPFDTIECVFLVEYSGDGKIWEKKTRKKVLWDSKQNFLKIITIKKDDDNDKQIECTSESFINGKVIEMKMFADFDEKLSFPSKKADESMSWCSIYSHTPKLLEIMARFEYGAFFYHSVGDKHMAIYETLNNELQNNPNFAVSQKNELQMNGITLTVDEKKGIILKRVDKVSLGGDKKIDLVTKFAENYINVNGRYFPRIITVKFHKMLSQKYGIIRVTLESDSLKVDEKISPAKFAVSIPSGTSVTDSIKGVTYQVGVPTTTLDAQEKEVQLKELIERAKK